MYNQKFTKHGYKVRLTVSTFGIPVYVNLEVNTV
jgi:hypothetical protein